MAEDTKLCSNCKREISAANFVMHEMHCRRHIVLCEHCEEPIHRAELEQHFNDLHAQFPCERCQQKVSKSDMAKHMEEDCIKKPMRCEFCELSFPKNEHDSHMDYCGSRTEVCPYCQQYIMLKDMLRHETSSCTYPEPKPQPQPQPSDPFSMEELQQLMNGTDFGNGYSRAAPFRKVQNPTNKKSDVNVQRAKNLSTHVSDDSMNAIPPDLDYDTMLALQLAHEDWGMDGSIEVDGENMGHLPLNELQPHGALDFEGYMTHGIEPWRDIIPNQRLESHAPARQRPTDFVEDDDISVPCEFCDMEVPLSTYMDHADACPLQPTGLAAPSSSVDLNNEQAPTQQSSRAAIPVINNLRSSGSPPSDEEYFHDAHTDFILPCEFCEEVFPSEIIIEHQSVCHANGNVSPRETPVVPSHRTSQPPSKPRSFKSTVKTRPKRQPDPAPFDFASRGGGDSEEIFNRDLRFQRLTESSSNKYSPAVNRFDDAVTRPPRRSSRQTNQEDTDEPETGRPSKSAQRARARLNQLLQEDLGSGAMGGADNRKKQSSPLAGQDLNRAEPKGRKKPVDSHTVMKQLEEAKRTSNKSTSKATRTSSSQPQQQLNTNNSQAPNSRNRQRSDHVFSPELRLKPDHNPPPKKR